MRDSISIDLSSERLRSPNRSSFTTSLELVSFQSHKSTFSGTCFCLSYTTSLELVSGQHPIIKLPSFSYIIHVLVFVYLIFNMFSKLPFYRPALREDQRWYRPFLDYTILISFKREFCIKISKKIQIVKLKDSDFFFFTKRQFIARNISF